MNAANEVVVEAFLRDEIGFLEMSDVIESTLQKVAFLSQPTYGDYVASDEEARSVAIEYVASL
jgi:1-deoxy-D-xylulose-5-phosphate reductoisomerase